MIEYTTANMPPGVRSYRGNTVDISTPRKITHQEYARAMGNYVEPEATKPPPEKPSLISRFFAWLKKIIWN